MVLNNRLKEAIMLWIILGAVIGFIITSRFRCPFYERFFMGILVTITCAFAGLLVSFFVGIAAPNSNSVLSQEKREIIALRDNSAQEGNFFLGVGSIREKQYYFYYWKDGDAIKFSKVNAENSEVYEVETSRPRVEIKTKETKTGFTLFRYIPGKNFTTVKFYVPEGTVTRDFELDLKN